VIGNPPYVRVDYLQGQEKKYFKQHYVAAQGKYDLYYLFIEKSFALLKDGGVHGFIVPNKFCTSDSGYEIRRTLIDKSKNIFMGLLEKVWVIFCIFMSPATIQVSIFNLRYSSSLKP
jgi:type I restriction-modification system DNA methylase subunit